MAILSRQKTWAICQVFVQKVPIFVDFLWDANYWCRNRIWGWRLASKKGNFLLVDWSANFWLKRTQKREPGWVFDGDFESLKNVGNLSGFCAKNPNFCGLLVGRKLLVSKSHLGMANGSEKGEFSARQLVGEFLVGADSNTRARVGF